MSEGDTMHQIAANVVGLLPLSIIRVDPNGVVTYANPRAEQDIGGSVVGKPALEIFAPELPELEDFQQLRSVVEKAPAQQLRNVGVKLQSADGAGKRCIASFALEARSGMVDVVFLDGSLEILGAVSSVTRSLVTGRDLSALLLDISKLAKSLVGAERAYFEVHDERAGLMHFQALSSSTPGEALPRKSSTPTSGLTRFVRDNKKIYSAPNIHTSEFKFEPLFKDVVSKIAIPLFFTERAHHKRELFCGVLMVDGTAEGKFSADAVELLEPLARYATLGIAQAHFLQELRDDSLSILEHVRTVHDTLGASRILHEAKNLLRLVIDDLEQIEDEVSSTVGGKRKWSLVQQTMDKITDMTAIISDLLRSMKTPEAHARRSEAVDLAKIVARVLKIVVIPEDVVKVNVTVPSDGEVRVHASSSELVFMVFNLVQNSVASIKRKGGGEVAIVLERSSERAHHWRMEVNDTGEGMERQLLELVRAEETVSRSTGGSGIGLISVRETVRRLKGTLKVDSKLGRYTRFTIDLPAA